MTFDREILPEHLSATLPANFAANRMLVAFSGGLDSTALLHALSAVRAELGVPLIALHVNHGLHDDADRWEESCRRFAGSLDVEFHSRCVTVDTSSGQGVEAAAREARYAALRDWMLPDDCLLSAHHEDDQAETLLLHLMRGSGVAGLAAIAACQPFGPGLLLRPLLGVSVQSLRAYAEAEDLHWVEDPSNSDTGFDRNYLRNQVLPKLATRWPAAVAQIGRSARLAREAQGLLDELAAIDLGDAQPERLEIRRLTVLDDARQRNLLRYAFRRSGLPPPPARRLAQIIAELPQARPDAEPVVRWSGAECRRYRDHLYLLPAMSDAEQSPDLMLAPDGAAVELGDGLGRLVLCAGAEHGIDPGVAANGLEIRFRAGGESIRPRADGDTRRLRNLLQEAGVVPWMRQRLPLLYAGSDLVAVADLWAAAEHSVPGGLEVRWEGRPPIY